MSFELDSPFLTIPETAVLMRVKPRTLDNLRWRKEGPPYRRHGGRNSNHRDEALKGPKQRRQRLPGASENKDKPPRPDRTCGLQGPGIRSDKTDTPRMLLNLTASVPTGIYLLSVRQPKMGS